VRAVAVDLRRLPAARGARLPARGARFLPAEAPGVIFAVPFLISCLLTGLLVLVAPRIGLVDHPGERKVHTRTTPKGGGLAIYAALALAAWLCNDFTDRPTLLFHRNLDFRLPLLGVGLVIVALGFLDDLRPLPWQLRLAVQTAAATWAVVEWPSTVS